MGKKYWKNHIVNIMNDIVNDKKGHNIVNDKIAVFLVSQTAYLLIRGVGMS